MYSPEHPMDDKCFHCVQNCFISIISVYKLYIADRAQLNLIYDAMKEYDKYTCIRLKPRTNEKDYVKFVSDNSGCWSYLGKVGGEQPINLQIPGCVTKKGTIMHEIMHAVGFWHEHTRVDRDNYVDIIWNNIIPSMYSRLIKK